MNYFHYTQINEPNVKFADFSGLYVVLESPFYEFYMVWLGYVIIRYRVLTVNLIPLWHIKI